MYNSEYKYKLYPEDNNKFLVIPTKNCDNPFLLLNSDKIGFFLLKQQNHMNDLEVKPKQVCSQQLIKKKFYKKIQFKSKIKIKK